MSKIGENIALLKIQENDLDDVLTIDDFVWVDKIADKSELWSSSDTSVNIAQHSDTEENSNIKERKDEIEQSSDNEKELLVEQQYWEQGYVHKKFNVCKSKYTSHQRTGEERKTLRELAIIEHQKSIVRSPAYYQFDKFTTLVLKLLRDKKIIGDYHNIVANGKSSVVIHANSSYSAPLWFSTGNAVKVYKLTYDLKHNDAIFKKVKRVHSHLLMLQNQCKAWYVPHLVHKCRNVIVTDFTGSDQKPAPSLASLPLEHSQEMYNILVKELHKLYNDIHLVHGDLSPKNILYYSEIPYYIGWECSVRREHPKALIKLYKDCHFIHQVSTAIDKTSIK